jgi:hypothetical protein
MKNFKIKIEETKNKNKCEWKFEDDPSYCRVEPKNIVNGKKYCNYHFSYFESVNRQFKILEEIEVEI